MNTIIRPITPCGMVGFDEHNQLCHWEVDGDSRVGRIIGDPRGHICRICQQGWILTAASLKDQKRLYEEWIHYTCFVRYLAMKDRDLFVDSLVAAEIGHDVLKEIPSQYWVNDPIWSKRYWYMTKALDQPIGIILGSRKRVYNIEFSATDDAPLKAWQEAAKEFAKEEVTKQFGPKRLYLHAWGGEQLKNYLERLSTVFGLTERELAGKK